MRPLDPRLLPHLRPARTALTGVVLGAGVGGLLLIAQAFALARLVTVAVLVDRMKINGSLARKCIADLEERGIIRPIVTHSKMKIYSTSKPGRLPCRRACACIVLTCRNSPRGCCLNQRFREHGMGYGVGMACMIKGSRSRDDVRRKSLQVHHFCYESLWTGSASETATK